jgi:HD superfamily phosphohydrolase
MKSIIITDPIYRVMNFGSNDSTRKLLRAIWDTQAFQRLRRISQLGLASLVFPGATHTRFSHSLGVAFLANQVLEHLLEREGKAISEHQEQQYAVLAAALLHDVGHGPFSHSFEQVLQNLVSHDHRPLHEGWSKLIIQHEQSGIPQALERSKVNIQQVVSVFDEESKSEQLPRYLKQIVSSQIDVDRMDYLLRDSHFAGVSVGTVDVFYLMHCLTVIKHDGANQSDLGLEAKGVKAYEAFALARQLMNRTVYYHKAVKVLEFMMEEFLRGIIKYNDAICKVGHLEHAVPQYLKTVAKAVDNQSLNSKDKKNEFMENALHDYLQLTEDRIWNLIWAIAETTDPAIPKKLPGLAKRLLKRHLFKASIIQNGKEKILDEKLRQEKYKKGQHYVIINTATTAYKSTSGKIFVESGNETIEEITKLSELIFLMRDRQESEYLLIFLDDKLQNLPWVSKYIYPSRDRETTQSITPPARSPAASSPKSLPAPIDAGKS